MNATMSIRGRTKVGVLRGGSGDSGRPNAGGARPAGWASPESKSGMKFPWVSTRTMQFTAKGEFPVAFPPECPLRLHFVQFTQEHRLTPSYHDHLEISLLYEGSGTFTVESHRYPVREGDLVVVGRREFHLMEANHRDAPKNISLYFLPELIYRPGGQPLDFEYLKAFRYHSPTFSHRIAAGEVSVALVLDRIRKIQQELEARRADYPLAAKTYLTDILLELSRHYGRLGGTLRDRDERVLDIERLREVFNFIRKNCGEPISLRRLAPMAHMSPGYFCRFFKAVTGMTPTEYLLRVRVDQAMELLASGARSITEIAYASGFGSATYFDRVFKRLKGMTPQEFRRETKV